MRLLARTSVGLLLVLSVAGISAWVFREELLDAVAIRFAEVFLSDPAIPSDGDLHLILCGTAGPVGGVGQRSACNAVIGDGEMLLIDAGAGGTVPGGNAASKLRSPKTGAYGRSVVSADWTLARRSPTSSW